VAREGARTGEGGDRLRQGSKGGTVAGLVGGVVLAIWSLFMGAIQGRDFWVGMKAASYPFLRARALEPGFDGGAVLLGLICHFAVSIAWGIAFGIVAYGLSRAGTIASGALWGLVVWIGMFFVVLPLVGAAALARGQGIALAVSEHVVFGLALGFGFLPYQRPVQVVGRPWRRRPQPT
jgi:hypothetical protein